VPFIKHVIYYLLREVRMPVLSFFLPSLYFEHFGIFKDKDVKLLRISGINNCQPLESRSCDHKKLSVLNFAASLL